MEMMLPNNHKIYDTEIGLIIISHPPREKVKSIFKYYTIVCNTIRKLLR
jgi:hypothetical protein